MAETSRPWSEGVVGDGAPALASWALLEAPALRWALRLAVVALAGSWLGFYLITPLPYLELDSFRATVTLHVITGIVVIPYLASLVLGRRLPGGSVLDAPLVALLGVYLLTATTGLDWRLSVEVTLTPLLAMAVFYVLSDGGLFRRWQIEWALMLAALAAAAYALRVVGNDYLDWLRLSDAVRGGLSPGDLVPPTVPKVHDVGDHPNLLSGILGMSLPFFFVTLFRPLPVSLRAATGLGGVAVGAAMFFALGRAGWLGGGTGVLVSGALLLAFTPGGRAFVARLRPRTQRQQVVLGAGVFLVGLAIAAALLVGSSVEERPIWLFRESGTPRLDVMEAGAEMVQDYPLLGTGAGYFGLLYPEYSGRFPHHAIHAHNGYLQTAVDMGIPGVLAMLALAGALGWLIVRGLRETEGEAQRSVAAAAGALVAFGVFSLLEAPNDFKGPLVALAAVGAVAVLSFREGRPADGPPAQLADWAGRPADGPPARTTDWVRAGRALHVAARVVVPVALLGLLITWGRIDAGHYYYNEGVIHANNERWAPAIEEAQRAVDLDPDFAIYRLELGVIQGRAYQETGNPILLQSAIGQLERAVELEPRSAIGHTNLALLLVEAGELDSVRTQALEALTYANKDPAVVLAAANALEHANWGEEAVDAYGYVLFLDLGLADSSFWTESPFRLARFPDIVARSALIFNPCAVLWLTGQEVPALPVDRPTALLECFQRVADLNMEEDRVILAEALIRDGEMDAAYEQLDYLVSLQPDNGPARAALGRWYAAQGDLAQAREQWLLGGQLDDVESLVLLGESYEPGPVPPAVVEALRSEVRDVASAVQFHITGVLYYRLKFQRGSPLTMLLPGEWRDAVPGRYQRAQDALARWEGR